ncbi:hypothetical protein NDU88_003170, partial [Pleurodeles waltl]
RGLEHPVEALLAGLLLMCYVEDSILPKEPRNVNRVLTGPFYHQGPEKDCLKHVLLQVRRESYG